MNEPDSDPFRAAFGGRFESVLRWEQLDAFWDNLRGDAEGEWYIYAVGEPPPTQAASGELFKTFLSEIAQLLRREHGEDFCGIVYADSLESPRFVKIFDPNNLGVSCGFSDNPPLPGWILSKLPPTDLCTAAPLPGNRRRWWQRLLGT
ncbi:MAG: hypothetical protein PVJ66_09125 [Gammaproteobacteria bacterium]|jgi:hypothetical protein